MDNICPSGKINSRIYRKRSGGISGCGWGALWAGRWLDKTQPMMLGFGFDSAACFVKWTDSGATKTLW